jgi:eukaryotic-like serine/threonine-protein kinase
MPLFDHLKTFLAGGSLNVSKRFTLLHEAISGTMSSFYMARDLQTGKVVGLKLLDLRKTAAFEARFKGLNKPSEGEIATQLKHPYIVETFEFGRTIEGAPYLVMEYLEGRTSTRPWRPMIPAWTGTASISSARRPKP